MAMSLQQQPSAPPVEDAATPLWKRVYSGAMMQIIILGSVCFLLPGMFNAINGLGAVGKADATITDNANTALAVTFAVCSLLAGGLFNLFGHRVLLFVGGLTYILYVGSYLSYNAIFVITSGAALGVGAGFLWTAQGAMLLSYPAEPDKGLYISIFWSLFNSGAIIGSVVSLALNWHNEQPHVSNQTYVAFMAIMASGCLLTFALLAPGEIQRNDGSHVASSIQASASASTGTGAGSGASVSTEAVAILQLFRNKRLLCLVPMFFSSNWFYTYQFNAVNGGGMFTTRTRALNGVLYWVAQVLGSCCMGRLLDYKGARRSKRAMVGLGVLSVATMTIWGSGFAFQKTYTRASVKGIAEKIDMASARRYAGPMVLYALYGCFDAVWQTYCYWIMGALTNETALAARMAGFYKAWQNAGAACAGQVDAKKVSYQAELLINWGLLGLGVVCAVPVAWTLQNSLQNSKDVEEEPPL